MPNHFELFKRFIGSFVEMSESEMSTFMQQCDRVDFSKGDLIIKAGEAQNNLYFITKGIVKNFIVTDSGEMKIYNFRLENMTVTGYAHYNYKDNLKALVNTQCIEDCIMIKVPLATIHYVINHIKFGERLGRLLAEAHFIFKPLFFNDLNKFSCAGLISNDYPSFSIIPFCIKIDIISSKTMLP